MPAEQPVDQPPPGPELLRGQARHQHLRQHLRVQAGEVAAQVGPELLTQPRIADRRVYGLLPGHRVLQRVLQQLGDVQHLDVVVAQRLGEHVMLLLGPADPGQPGEEQGIPRAWRDPPQLGPWAVSEHCPQLADLTVERRGCGSHCPLRVPRRIR